MVLRKAFIGAAAGLLFAGAMLMTACGGVPGGITDDGVIEPQKTEQARIGASADPTYPPLSPAPTMDLTPENGIQNGMEAEKEAEAAKEKVNVTLHYITDEGYVLPVLQKIEKQDGIARACLNELICSDQNELTLKQQGLRAPIPRGTQIALNISDGEARVNLVGMSGLDGPESEAALFTAIVNTLTQFPSVQVVTISVDGEGGETAHGSKLPNKADTFALNPEKDALETQSIGSLKPITLYFPNASGSRFIPITRYVSTQPSLTNAVSQLAKGTQMSGLRSFFPENTLILGAAIENGVLRVNCSKDLERLGDTPGMYSLAVHSVLLTAMKYGSIDEVRFLVNGAEFEPKE